MAAPRPEHVNGPTLAQEQLAQQGAVAARKADCKRKLWVDVRKLLFLAKYFWIKAKFCLLLTPSKGFWRAARALELDVAPALRC